MATQFVLPRQVKIQPTGIPYANAVATFYAAGTLVPQTVYQDFALTTPHSIAGVVADDDGYFAVIWLNPAAAADYRVIIRSAAGPLLDDIDNIPRNPLTAAQIGQAFYPQTANEQAASATPTDFRYPEGDLRRYGVTGAGSSDDSVAWQKAVSVRKVFIPKDFSIKVVTPATVTGSLVIQGEGPTSKILCDGTVITVTSGTGSTIDNVWLENLTAPWIITRDPTAWTASISGTLAQSNNAGYQPTVNDADIWSSLTSAQQNQQIGPAIVFTGNAENIQISRVYGRFVRIDLFDCRNSTVRDCNIRGGKGTWGAINFDNETNNAQTGLNNRAINNIVQYASYNGIIFQNNDRPVAEGNTCSLNGESGIKPAGGADRKCVRAVVVGNVCAQNYYDGIDLVTSFPTNTTIEALHKATGNHCYQNGGDGINVDGKYSTIDANTIERNGRYGIWCTGASTTITNNILIDNNQERNASFPEILGGGADGCYIVGNRIQSGAGANSAAIYYDSKGYIAKNYAVGSSFFFGTTPTSFLSENVDDSTGLLHEQSFVFELVNTAGTLQHAFYTQPGASTVSSTTLSRITGVSATLTTTPTATDSSTAFAAGGKISSVATSRFIFDTAAQFATFAKLSGPVIYNDTTTAIQCQVKILSTNVNGVTLDRLVFEFTNASTGAAFALTTGNIGSGKKLQVQFYGRLS